MFIVIEIQKTDDQVATIVNAYANYSDAMARYHTVLAAAAKSEIDTHSAVIIDEYGKELISESY